MPDSGDLDVVCLSLEPWDDVWRRNQHVASHLLRLRPNLRILFVGPPIDVIWSLRKGSWPSSSALRPIGPTGRLWTMAPRKWLPRRLWPRVDRSLFDQVLKAISWLKLQRPVLWINDSTYAPLVTRTGWPSLYDVTDDWLLARGTSRESERQDRNDSLLLRHGSEIVVCSPALAESRGRDRPVHVITNGVDIERLRSPTERPADLPSGPVVLYQGTLVDGRLDVDLCAELCQRLTGTAHAVFVGPNSLSRTAHQRLEAAGAVILDSRPYTEMPAYLQHADVLVVPHAVTPFTESLDPIKAREYLAVGRPVVSTPVAGFRELDPPFTVVGREGFVDAVSALLRGPVRSPGPGPLEREIATWADQSAKFMAVIDSVVAGSPAPSRE